MHVLIRALVIASILIAGAVRGSAATLRVNSDASGFRSIQRAIDASHDGDVILVEPGVYHESLNTLGKSIVLRSTAGAAVTIIDAGRRDRAITVLLTIVPGSRIEGFTVKDGHANGSWGGGMFAEGTEVVVQDCVFTGNRSDL